MSLHSAKHLIGLQEYLKMNAWLNANGAMIANPKEYYERHGTLYLQNVCKVVPQACLYKFVKVFACITSHSCDCSMAGSGRRPLQTAEWYQYPRGICALKLDWRVWMVGFDNNPSYRTRVILLGWEVGHTVGPLLWGWELDVTVHSTCLNARMGGWPLCWLCPWHDNG
jgi:hypothetical protein